MARRWLGKVEAHGRKLRMRVHIGGKRVWEDTGYVVGQEAMAELALARRRAQIHAAEDIQATLEGPDRLGPLTVSQYAKRWVQDRLAREVGYATKEQARFRDHINPFLGKMAIADVRPRHVRAFVNHLKTAVSAETGDALAPRTIRHIYFTLRQMMREAAADEVIPLDPCHLKAGELPKKRDKTPGARALGDLSPDEVTHLLTDPRVPEDRRVQYALEFLTGSRPGEIAARRWRDWHPEKRPLGKLDVLTAWDTTGKKEKPTKSERERLVPVHPFLAAQLAAWRLGGWARFMGRKPTPEDLILPAARGGFRSNSATWRAFRDDLEALGIPHRRHYSTRQTFISWAMAGGASKDMLRWITHAPGDVFDKYQVPRWETLCEQVACIRLAAGSRKARPGPKGAR